MTKSELTKLIVKYERKTEKRLDKIIAKLENIMKTEGLIGWKLIIINSGGGLCLNKKKQIWLDKKNLNIPFLLHEIAHALTHKWNNKMGDKTGHHSIWGDKFTQLVIKYNIISEQKKDKEYNRGFDDGVEAEAKVKKGTKRLCSECKKKLMG